MMGINAAYATFDATSLLYVKRHGGQYNMIFFVKSLVEPIVTAFSGLLVVESATTGKKITHWFSFSRKL